MKTGSFLGSMFLLLIPFVNLILIIVWACAAKNPNKRSWMRAMILFSLIGFALTLILAIVAYLLGASWLTEILSGIEYYY